MLGGRRYIKRRTCSNVQNRFECWKTVEAEGKLVKQHFPYDIHTQVRQFYGLIFAIDIPAPVRRSPKSVDALVRKLNIRGRVSDL